MKKFLSTLLLSMAVYVANAIPAYPGIWRTVKLADGSEVKVMLRGDEHVHFWQSADGTAYVPDGESGLFKAVSMKSLEKKAVARQKRMARAANTKGQRFRAPGENKNPAIFQGSKRGLILLVEFSDKHFSMPSPKNFYTHVANDKGYREGRFQGSIRDYFHAQSGGQFDLTFDIVGPIKLPRPYRYYGMNNDDHAADMIRTACLQAKDSVDFSTYDWDNDGEAEEVFVLYAGHGQADSPVEDDDLIWPHMSNLASAGYRNFKLDNTIINTYACSSELRYTKLGGSEVAGIGTFCHEFSHCMGFPDMYDTAYSGNYGMGSWDLMDNGAYNGDGFVPAGYTGYEKMVCGWTKPVELTADTTITGRQCLADMGQTYIVYNDADRNEYYILDNRQLKGFDAQLPGRGMIISHIDYDATLWRYNAVNTTVGTYAYGNDHQHVTIFHANGYDESMSHSGLGRLLMQDEGGATYPY
ncbi:MAG: M6 family metalloprotease domain-containing protein, partial [Prevotellaceae bacterium]|nr:M6 family metalloprotease domain-containing protein [Prevotellaceae bacterium]